MDSPELFPAILKIFSALAVTVGVMIAIAYLFKKMMRQGGPEGHGELIRVLSSRYMGPKSSIMLVDVLGHIMVIGNSGGTFSMLKEIMDPEALERLNDTAGDRCSSRSFSDHLKDYLKKRSQH